MADEQYYGRDLARLHHEAFSAYAGGLAAISPVRERGGLVPEARQSNLRRREDERHETVLIDTSDLSALRAPSGVRAEIARSLWSLELPEGTVVQREKA